VFSAKRSHSLPPALPTARVAVGLGATLQYRLVSFRAPTRDLRLSSAADEIRIRSKGSCHLRGPYLESH